MRRCRGRTQTGVTRGVSHDMVGEEAGDRARAEDTGQPGLIGPVCDAREWPPAVQVRESSVKVNAVAAVTGARGMAFGGRGSGLAGGLGGVESERGCGWLTGLCPEHWPPPHTYVGVVNRKGGSGQEHIQGGWESQRYFKSGLLSFISKSC